MSSLKQLSYRTRRRRTLSAVSKLVTDIQSRENIDIGINTSGGSNVVTMPLVDLSAEPYQL